MNTFDDNVESSDEDSPIGDTDTCSQEELNRLFTNKLSLASEEAVTLKKNYILHLAHSTDFTKIATASSDNQVHLFNLDSTNGLSRTSSKLFTIDSICGIRAANQDPNSLILGTEAGSLLMVDLRTETIVSKLCESSDEKTKPISCFDVNQNDRIVCAGTERLGNDAFLLFYDVRKTSSIGGYWQSHADDITQVRFHPHNPDCLATGSTDGLINIFDISNADEDDALQTTLNTDSSVQQIQWHRTAYDGSDVLSCITHTQDLQMFDVKEQELLVMHTREAVTESMKRKSSIDCNLINSHSTSDGSAILLATSNFNRGECLRTLAIQNRKLIPSTDLTGNKQIIRASVYNQKEDFLVTGGEMGILSLWTPAGNVDASKTTDSFKEKSKSKLKNAKRNPY